MDASVEAAITGASHATLLRVVAELADGVQEFEIARTDAERLRLDGVSHIENGTRVRVPRDAVLALASWMLEIAAGHQVEIPFDEFERTGERLRAMARESMRLEGHSVLSGMTAIASKARWRRSVREPARGRLSVPTLQLVQKLDPRVTVPARIARGSTAAAGGSRCGCARRWFDDCGSSR